MIEKKITLYNIDYHLKINDDKVVTGCTFCVRGKLPAQMTEDEMRQGQEMTQNIFNGAWYWLIFANDVIRLSEFKIEIHLTNIEYDGAVRWGGARLIGGLKETCTHCEDPRCDWDCMDALEWASDRDIDMQNIKNEELESNRNFNYAADALEAVILAHAQAGVDVTSNIYVEGFKTAVDAISNNI
jgi:hypothetical protein